MTNPHMQWLLKVLQPTKTLGALPGIATLTEDAVAALLGLDAELYRATLSAMQASARDAAAQLLDDAAVRDLVDRLPLARGEKIVAFGDSLTADPQSWAVLLSEVLALRRPQDALSFTISAVPGEATTHGLVRIGEVLSRQPDWLLVFTGTNDARTQGPTPGKTLVSHEETARNLAELRRRASSEGRARRLWVTPPAVDEAKVAAHQGLARFGVRFRNTDLAQVARHVRALNEPVVDLASAIGAESLMDDGLHLSLEGHKRIALEVLRVWSALPREPR